ncbi:MAG: aminotransferase class I/II-fold pyridoxal phosphate-dependent enzyme [bacterium]|nr:aminotransferase class I/II-fold pyridoxal phosphate-dependent enzyme [bacterium]
MDGYLYYNQQPDKLKRYQRLIQYWSMTFGRGEQLHVLDNMNFNISIFPEIISFREIDSLHRLEPGYTSPDGDAELGRLIRELEFARLVKDNPDGADGIRDMVEKAGIGCGNGCTNVMYGVLNSVASFFERKYPNRAERPEVIMALPNYTVYDAQISSMSSRVTPKYIHSKRENDFLPVYEDVLETVTPQTAAIIVTYPNNPAQSTYEGENIDELKKILGFCQEKGIFLIVDNIYQDVIFPRERGFTEIFSLTGSLDYVVKVYGCSKDTPFYSGYRTGYWIGDPVLTEHYKYFISSRENSMNTHSLAFFALNLYFKMKQLDNGEPEPHEMEYFASGIFGWRKAIDQNQLFDNLSETELFRKYKSRIALSDSIQEEALDKAIDYVNQSGTFCDCVNQRIGNVFFIKVNPTYFNKTDDQLFHFLFDEGNIAILPGNVFGIPDSPGEVWFRITLMHDHIDTILDGLGRVERLLQNG